MKPYPLALTLVLAGCAVACTRRAEPAPAPATATSTSTSTTTSAVCAESGRITGTQAKKLVAEGAVLVDVRTTDEYDDKHLPGAVNISVDQIGARFGELPKDKPLVLYCHSGARAHRAATTLKSKGFAVHELGGMDDWDKTACP